MGLSCTEIPDFATVFNNVYNAIGSDNFTKFPGQNPTMAARAANRKSSSLWEGAKDTVDFWPRFMKEKVRLPTGMFTREFIPLGRHPNGHRPGA